MAAESPSLTVDEPSVHGVSRSRIDIEPRRVGFEYEDVDSPFFYEGNPCISAMWVSLSASFPLGEAEFIKSTRFFEDQITDEKLKEDVKNFVQQEAHHSLQHRQVNKYFDGLGYSTSKLEDFYKQELDKRANKWSHERRLAHTVVVEHVTAVMAHYALTKKERMAGFPESIRSLFQWHAIEEIEHKSVTFDVYQHCVGNRKLLMWAYYYFFYYEFPLNVYLSSRFLLKDMGYKVSWAERKGLWNYLNGEDGLVSSMKPLYRLFRKPGFHPWDHDDSALVADWKQRLSPYFK
ncbi:metal-dependent hydrolase [Arenicella sp. 4NH20-0111]|uniref:metal-dependent hydrolase n=1 Tax=Arenicella sp. 4NH20-0111 TaxID=3127648 RepID=UPI0031071D6C